MTTNLRLENLTCHAYIFERLLSYVFYQIDNLIMVLIKTIGQKTKRLWDLAVKNSSILDARKQKNKILRSEHKFQRPRIFCVPFTTPTCFTVRHVKPHHGCMSFGFVCYEGEGDAKKDNCLVMNPLKAACKNILE